MSEDDITIGNPDRWSPFGKRNAAFVERMENLRSAFNTILNREWSSAEPADRFVFVAGHIAVDDFLEIFVMCGNAEAYGAQKILRGLFERVVTLKYLHLHPEEVEKYANYFWIGQYKLVNAIETTFKQGLLDPEKVKEAAANYQKFKDEYKLTLCKKCKTTRPGISWTPKDIVTMAKEVGMVDFVVPCYYLPMQHAHPTVQGMLERITQKDGRIVPTERLQPDVADRVLCAAHALVLHALNVQVEHFNLDPAPYTQAESDFVEIWKKRPSDLHTPPVPQE
jgi:hypothetical protein